jgi:hypothetical protein
VGTVTASRVDGITVTLVNKKQSTLEEKSAIRLCNPAPITTSVSRPFD